MNIKNKFFRRSMIISLLVSIFLVNSGVSYAKLSKSTVETLVKDVSIKDCDPANIEKAVDAGADSGENNLDTIYLNETKKFITFLQQTTSNPSDTSSLSNTILAKFREFKKDLDAIEVELLKKNYSENVWAGWKSAEEFFTYKGITSYNDSFASAQKCSQLKTKYVQMAKDNMLNKITDSANRKKSVILMEKLQAINNRLREMNSKITTLYGLFKTFSNKIICFEANKCMAL